MKRRSFVKASLLTTVPAAVVPQISKGGEVFGQKDPGFYELRVYTLSLLSDLVNN